MELGRSLEEEDDQHIDEIKEIMEVDFSSLMLKRLNVCKHNKYLRYSCTLYIVIYIYIYLRGGGEGGVFFEAKHKAQLSIAFSSFAWHLKKNSMFF